MSALKASPKRKEATIGAKKSGKSFDVSRLEKLARAVVNKRLAFLNGDCLDFVDPAGEDSPREEWATLLELARTGQCPNVTREVLEAFRTSVGDRDYIVDAIGWAHAAAGFLVGLELGRRLGGGGR